MGRKDRRRRQRPAKKAAVAGEGLDPAAALTAALAHHQAGRIAQAERIYGQILAAQPNNADALHLLGVAAHQTGRHDRAITFIEKAVRHASPNPHYLNNLGEAYRAHARLADAAGCYRRALELDPGFAGAHYNLGLALAGQGDMAGAVACYRRALKIDADDAQTHCTLGDALRKRGDPAEAIACYRRALEIDPGLAEAHNNLGNALSERGDLDDAVACYRRALEIDPSLARTLGNLGNALRQRDDPAGAIACYRRALEIDPGNAQTHANLGDALSDQENPEAAIVCYRRALEIDPDDARTHAGLGYALSQQDRWDEATACYRRALEIDPGLAAVHTRLGNVLSLQGCVEDADDAYGRALEIRPGDARAQWGRTLLLPVIYTSEDEIEVSRARWVAGLDRFIDNLELGTQDQIDDAKRILTQKTNFYLHYQGKNDLKLQTVYGTLIHRIASAAYPDFSRPIRKRAIRPGERIRVGFVSSNFYRHTVCRLFGQWIGMLNKDVFEIHTFHTGKTFDQATEDIKRNSDVFHERLHSSVRWIDAIRSADLDVLIYTDIGMAPRMQALAALRLAPVQCATWGHPVTSGLPTVDYYLSSELMEPEDGKTHYSEKLVTLANLSIAYPYPEAELLENPANGKPEDPDRPVYLCAQSLFKLLPQFDRIYPEIASQVGECRFWFIQNRSPSVTDRFRARLERGFRARGMDAHAYCELLPPMSHSAFFRLNHKADIVLDSALWSGGNTTLEAIACDKPVVTLPGPMMRSRHTYAILKMMKAEDTIAHDVDEYVAIAVRLGRDHAWREKVVRQIRKNKATIYGDAKPVRDLEKFLKSVCDFQERGPRL